MRNNIQISPALTTRAEARLKLRQYTVMITTAETKLEQAASSGAATDLIGDSRTVGAREGSAGTRQFKHYPALDGLRAFAILWVMGYHGLGPIGACLGRGGGWAGVDVFFVISGFLITSILLKERDTTGSISFGRFYARRILRLVPAYYLFLGATWLINPLHCQNMPAAIGICLVYLSNYDQIFNWGHVTGSATEITWSLSVEEQFYFLWPGLIKFARRHLWKLAVALIAACQVWKAYLLLHGADYLRMSSAFDTKVDVLMFGCLAAIAANHERLKQGLMKIFANQYIGFALLAVLFVYVRAIGHPRSVTNPAAAIAYWDLRMTGLAVVTTALILAVVLQPQTGAARFIGNRLFAYIGRISYSLYLWHIMAFLAVMHFVGPITNWYQELAGYGLAIAIAALSYHFVEQPFLRLKTRFASGT